MSREDWELLAWGVLLGFVAVLLFAAAYVNGKLG